MVAMQGISLFSPRVRHAKLPAYTVIGPSNFRYQGSMRSPQYSDGSPFGTLTSRQTGAACGWNPINQTLVIGGVVPQSGRPSPVFAELSVDLTQLVVTPDNSTTGPPNGNGSLGLLNTAKFFYGDPNNGAPDPFTYCGGSDTTTPNDPGTGIQGNTVDATPPGAYTTQGYPAPGFVYFSGGHVYTSFVCTYDANAIQRVVFTRSDNLQGLNNIGGLCQISDVNGYAEPRGSGIYCCAIPDDWKSKFANKTHYVGSEAGGLLSTVGSTSYGPSFVALNLTDINPSNVATTPNSTAAVSVASYMYYTPDPNNGFPNGHFADIDGAWTTACQGGCFFSGGGKAGIIWVGGRYTNVSWYGFPTFAAWATDTTCANATSGNAQHYPGTWQGPQQDPNFGDAQSQHNYGIGPMIDLEHPPLKPAGLAMNKNPDGSYINPSYPGQPAGYVNNYPNQESPCIDIGCHAILAGCAADFATDLGLYYTGTNGTKGNQADGVTPCMWIADPNQLSQWINAGNPQQTPSNQPSPTRYTFDQMGGPPNPWLVPNTGNLNGLIFNGVDTIYLLDNGGYDHDGGLTWALIHVYKIVTP